MLKILVVDDEAMVLNVVERILRKAGYDTLAAENADAACEFAAANKGDIGLLVVNHSLNGRPGRNLVDDILRLIHLMGPLFPSSLDSNASRTIPARAAPAPGLFSP